MIFKSSLSFPRPINLFFSAKFKYIAAQTVSLLLIFSIFTTSSLFAAPQTAGTALSDAASRTYSAILFGEWSSSAMQSWTEGLRNWVSESLTAPPPPPASTPNAAVASIQISPGSITVRRGEQIFFAATAFDGAGSPISGVSFEWRLKDTGRNLQEGALLNEKFEARRTGTYLVKAKTANGTEAQAIITVEGEEGDGGDSAVRLNAKQAKGSQTQTSIYSSSRETEFTPQSVVKPVNSETFQPRVDESKGNKAETEADYSGTHSMTSPIGGWDEGNWQTADNFGSQVGNPPGGPSDGGASNGNFQINTPVVSLSGRGLGINLGLTYNSRLWHKAGSNITYDIDKGNVAPGWSIGYGKIVHTGSAYGRCFLVGADGTRHSFDGNTDPSFPGSGWWTTYFNGRTTDGSFINYSCWASSTSYGSGIGSGAASLPNGTTISYGASNGFEAYPTRITDANGNYLTITYQGGRGPNIETVTDTMGRTVRFYYANNRLISIAAPGLDGAERTLVRLTYRQLNLSPGFSGLVVNTPPDAPWVVNAVYYPGNNTGYWFGDADSYSSYGMIAKVVKQRDMTWSGNAGEQGTISGGVMTHQAVYNYPLTADNTLTDAPMYTKRTDRWEGIDVNPVSDPVETLYNIDNNSTPRKSEVVRPDKTKIVSYTPGAGQTNEGWVTKTEVFAEGGTTSLSTTETTYDSLANSAYKSPRATKVETTNERGQKTKTEFGYGSHFNQATSIKEYDFGGTQVLRETRNTYNNDPAYIGTYYGPGGFVHYGRHIFNLVTSTSVHDGTGNRVSLAEFVYDGQTLKNTPSAYAHNLAFNPYAGDSCGYQPDVNDPDYGYPACTFEGHWSYNPSCDGVVPDIWVCTNPFDAGTNARGNITEIKTYSNAAPATPAGLISQTMRYDMTGNLVTSSSSCCEQTTITYDSAYNYAYPTVQMQGAAPESSSPHKQTTSTSYNYYTGLPISSRDSNNIESTVKYDPQSLRAIEVKSGSGGYQKYLYNDSVMSVTTEMREVRPSANTEGALAGKSIQYLNGLGQVKKSATANSSGIWEDEAAVEYDKMGRAKRQSRPYRAGEQLQWSEAFYDALGRVYKTVAPDGSTSESFFNETQRPDSASNLPGQTVKSRDAWGRERWARTDALGRLVEVVEPNPNGNGSVLSAGTLATQYLYNIQDNLVETVQGTQRRLFAYDSLGRLTRQKLAEQTATIDDAGQYVRAGGTGAKWSESFSYDNRSNLIQRIDARGVKTNYDYAVGGASDPLNRLHGWSYEIPARQTGDPLIHAASNVAYEYEPGGDKTRIKKIMTGVNTEEYVYESANPNRLKDYKLTVLSRPGKPLVTSYSYDSLDRLTQFTYPEQYGLAGGTQSVTRKTVKPTYNAAGDLTKFEYNNQQQAGDFVYNANGQLTSLKIGTGINQLTEEYGFDLQTGLLTNQKVKKANGDRLLDLSYEYRRNINGNYVAGRTGSLTEITNHLDRNKDRAFDYDSLGRLTKATGGINQTWTQNYSYDRYGNRTTVATTGVEALRAPGTLGSLDKKAPSSLGQKNQTKLAGAPHMANSAPENKSALSKMPPTAEELVAKVNSLTLQRTSEKGGPREDAVETAEETLADNSSLQKSDTENPENAVAVKNSFKTATKTVSNEGESTVFTSNAQPPVTRTPFDFDGDGKADPSVWNRSNYTWTVKGTLAGQTTQALGSSGNQIAPGDYDNDGKTDYAVWNCETGEWKVKQSSNGAVITVQWGAKGDTIVPADYDGDGKTDYAVWRASTSYWYILQSSNGQVREIVWGGQQYGDIPIQGDYDGDGTADIAVWRPTPAGMWYVLYIQSSTGQYSQFQWGYAGDVPVPADYDGDGKTDLAVWRPSNGTWYIYQSGVGQVIQAQLGSEAQRDVLVPANYDGAGGADPAVYRPSTGTWSILNVASGTVSQVTLGTNNDVAVPNSYIRRSSAPRGQSVEMPRDGHANLTFDVATNRLALSTGFQYDNAGNQTRALSPDGSAWYRFEYDAANRLVYVKNDAESYIHQANTYGATNERLSTWGHGAAEITYFVWGGGSVLAEYQTTETQTTVLNWTKSYVYLDSRLLSTIVPGGVNVEKVKYHHADRLGTRLISDPADGTYVEQTTLPYGTALDSESTGASNHRFTSYDRNGATKLDYAVNRTYDSGQGRFTTVDPINMSAASLANPQSLNLYAYVQNDPINFTDPTGLLLSGCSAEYSYAQCGGDSQFWGSGGYGGGGIGYFGDGYAYRRYEFEGMPDELVRGIFNYEEMVNNAIAGHGFITNAEYFRWQNAAAYLSHPILGQWLAGEVIFTSATGTGDFFREMQRRTAPMAQASEGFVHGFTGGLIDELDQREKRADRDSDAFKLFDTLGEVAGMVTPGPGGKVTLANKLGVSVRNLKHISKHLAEFQALKPSATISSVVRLGRQISSNSANFLRTEGGRQIFERTVNIGGHQVPVRVVLNPNGGLRSVHIRR